MQTSVSLQEPYEFSIIPIIVLMIIICSLVFVLFFLKKNKEIETEVQEVPQKKIKNIPAIKSKHIQQLNEIEHKYKNSMIELRQAYQAIS